MQIVEACRRFVSGLISAYRADGMCNARPMSDDFYCDEAISGRTTVDVVIETDEVLAFHHTRPFWPVHIVVVPKRHVPSLTDLGDAPDQLLTNVLDVVRQVATDVEAEYGACRTTVSSPPVLSNDVTPVP